MPYSDSMTHRLTVAAIHTPAGQPITSDLHDKVCLTCPSTATPTREERYHASNQFGR
jgi:hypothetical protein